MPIFSHSIYSMLRKKGYARCITPRANYDYTREDVRLQIDMCWDRSGAYTFVLIYKHGNTRRWAGTFDMGDELPFTVAGEEDAGWQFEEKVPLDIFPDMK